MNIFAINNDPVKSGHELCDQHIVKMPIENCQMWSAAKDTFNPKGETYMNYPKSVAKHGCTLWLHEDKNNWRWMFEYHEAMLEEYTARFGKVRKESLTQAVAYFKRWLRTAKIPDVKRTVFYNGTPYKDKESMQHPVSTYRRYYRQDKIDMARWRHSDKPIWL